MSNVLDAARQYIGRGWRVLPLNGKIPAIKKWPEKASTDPAQIARWFGSGNKNLGIATGAGLAVVDVDGPEGLNTLRAIVSELPRTLCAETGRGMHLYFSVDGPCPTNSGQGLDIRGDGGMVVAPPSIHPSGRRYVWIDASAPIAPMPPALLAWFRNRPGGKRSAPIANGGVPPWLASCRAPIADKAMAGAHEAPGWDDLEAVARAIPNDNVGWDEWNRIGLAFWAATEGDQDGRRAWSLWSEKSKKHDEQTCIERWGHYSKSPPNSIGFGTLVYLCQEADPSFWLPSWGPRPDAGQVNGAAVAVNLLDELNKHHAVICDVGTKCLVMSLDRNTLQTFQSFKERYLNQTIIVNKKKQPLGDAWLKFSGRTQYQGIELDVTCPGRRTPKGNFNLWNGFAVNPKVGRWALLQRHILEVLAAGNNTDARYIIDWMAWAIQNPGEPAEVALVLRGGKGTGKGMFANALLKLFGAHGLQISSSEHLTGKHNEHLRDCLLLFADEAYWAGDKKGESALKRLLTEPTIFLEPKFVNAFTWPNRLHVIMAANADWVVPASHDERRYAVFNVADSRAWDRTYFAALKAEIDGEGLGAMLYDLQRLDLKGFHPRDIPNTAALQEQKMLSLPVLQEWRLGILENAIQPGKNAKGQCPSFLLLESVRQMPGGARVTDTKLGNFMKKEFAAVKGHDRMGNYWIITDDLIMARKRWENKFGKHDWDDKLEKWQ